MIRDRDEDIVEFETKLKQLKQTIYHKEEEINSHKLDLIAKQREILTLNAKKVKDSDDLYDQSTRGSLNTMMERISQNITTIRNSIVPQQFQKVQFLNREELLLKDKYIEEVNKKHLKQIMQMQQKSRENINKVKKKE